MHGNGMDDPPAYAGPYVRSDMIRRAWWLQVQHGDGVVPGYVPGKLKNIETVIVRYVAALSSL